MIDMNNVTEIVFLARNTDLPPDNKATNDSCNLLPSSNTTLPLAPRWENIPETLLLNGLIGSILFITFLILTKIAWNRLESPDINLNQGLITFLYGYRDPQRWYCIPRFEFLRYKDRHHKHDMEYPNMYAPPKLPLANPIDLFANDKSKSLEITKSSSFKSKIHTKTLTKKTIKNDDNDNNFYKSTANNNNNKNSSSIRELKLIKTPESIGLADSTSSTTLKTRNSSQSSIDDSIDRNLFRPSELSESRSNKLSKLESSFFYPSVLTAEQLHASFISRKLNSFFSTFYRVTDGDIIYAKGIDAYEYLLFQRHLILIMFVTNLFCLGVILPVHWYAGSDTSILYPTSFQRTTIKSVDANSTLYWAHIISSICIVMITAYILKSYKDSITITKSDTQLARRTLLIGNIPINQRNRIELMRIFREFFPRSSVEAIQFIYTTDLLERYQLQLHSILFAKEYCNDYKKKYNQEIMVKTTDVNLNQYCAGYCRLCSFMYVCCFNWPFEKDEVGSILYTKEEQNYRNKISKACKEMVRNPSDYAFITFKSYNQAKRVMERLARFKAEILQDSTILTNMKLKSTNLLIGSRNKPHLSITQDSVDSSESQPKNSVSIKVAGKGGGSGSGSGSGGRPTTEKNVIETASPSNDPLDPKNDPHVRSIRSPIDNKNKPNGKDTTATKTLPTSNNRSVDKKPLVNEDNNEKLEFDNNSVSTDRENSTSHKSHLFDGPLRWSVRYAPHPDNVEFYDILHLATTSKFTISLYHLLMIIIFIFFTTPNVVLSILERLYLLRPDKAKEFTGYQGLIINYISILIQIITTELLPTLITLISKQIPYENSASKNHSIMWKVYAFLILMVIIMPSIGMSSAQALISSEINPKCLFPTDNGAYYINYVLSSIFLSTILELIKPSDILFYSFIFLTGRSKAEFEGARRYITNEFSVSMQHTSVLLIFSVVMTYTISCPLIAPAGLVYLIVKHSVDRYHLYYTYFTKKVDASLQNTILIFVKLSLLLMLLQTTLAISINTGVGFFTFVSQIVFWISLAVFVFGCFFDMTTRDMISSKRNRYQRELCACYYTPRVIGDLLKINAIPESCISRKV